MSALQFGPFWDFGSQDPRPNKKIFSPAALHNLIYGIQPSMLLDYSERVGPWLIILFVRTISGRLSTINYHNKAANICRHCSRQIGLQKEMRYIYLIRGQQ